MMGGASPPTLPYPPNDPTGVHRFARAWTRTRLPIIDSANWVL